MARTRATPGIRLAATLALAVTAGCEARRGPESAAGAAIPDTSVTPAIPAIPATPAVPATPAIPATATATAAAPVDGPGQNSLGMRFRVVAAGEVLVRIPDPDAPKSARDVWMLGAEGRSAPPPRFRPARVTRSFAIGICEVKLAEFVAVMGRAPAQQCDDFRIDNDDPERPAVSVSWDEAAEFCRRLGELDAEVAAGRRYRLPTEAEWQLAEKSGAIDGPCFSYGSRPIHWAVWELCSNRFDLAYYETMPVDDPQGPESGSTHVCRLGWSHPDPVVQVYTIRVVAELAATGR